MKSGKYTLIDIPVYVSPEWYEVNVNAVCSAIMNHGKIRSVYRIGSVTTPGISDLDLIVVFKDETSTAYDPLAKVDERGKYLFVHPLFGVCERHFTEIAKLTHFHNYRLIGGDDVYPKETIDSKTDDLIRRQTATEFMVKLYFVMSMQMKYRIIKVRTFLLEARALHYDLEFLGVKDGELHSLVDEVIALRSKWFLNPGVQDGFVPLFERIYFSLEKKLRELLKSSPMFTPGLTSGSFSANVKWQASADLKIVSSGFPFPSFPAGMFKRRYFNFLNRSHKFTLHLPVNSSPPEMVLRRFELTKEITEYNKKYIPYFTPLASSLRLQ